MGFCEICRWFMVIGWCFILGTLSSDNDKNDHYMVCLPTPC